MILAPMMVMVVLATEPAPRSNSDLGEQIVSEPSSPHARVRKQHVLGRLVAGELGGAVGATLGVIGGAMLGYGLFPHGGFLNFWPLYGALLGGGLGDALGASTGVVLFGRFVGCDMPGEIPFIAALVTALPITCALFAMILVPSLGGFVYGPLGLSYGTVAAFALVPVAAALCGEYGCGLYRPSTDDEANLSVAPIITPGGGGLALSARF